MVTLTRTRQPRRRRRTIAIVALAIAGCLSLALARAQAASSFSAVEGAQFSQTLVTGTCATITSPTIDWGDGSSSPGTAGSSAISGTHTYAEEGTFNGSVSWNDDCGSHTSPFTVVVADAQLRAAGASVAAIAGSSFSGVVATFSDADPGGVASDYTASIAWGDGTSSAGTVTPSGSSFVVRGTHTYATAGSYSTAVSIFDAGGASTVAHGTANVSPPAPAITGISPSSGPPAGGTSVTITGSSFTGATAVTFGSTPASSFTVNSDSQITAVAPPGTGTVDVTVTTPYGTSATGSSDRYSYVAGSPVVSTGAPMVQSSTGAAFTGTVNPLGLPTTAHFEYSLDQRYGIATISSTPDQSVGSDTSSHAVSASVSGLVPNALYHVRLVASNSAGSTTGPDQTFMTAKDPPPPPPTLGKSFDAAPVSGLVFVRLPGGRAQDSSALRAGDRALAHAAQTTGKGFIPLTEARNLPTGTQIDARRGTMKLIAALPQRHKTETGKFGGALFGLSQARRGASKGVATLTLLEGLFRGAPSYASCPRGFSRRTLQTLHASDRGHYRSRGHYAAATVRGTVWITTDRCDGTLITVKRGTVVVDDFVRHVRIVLHAHHSYLAKARRRR